MTIFSLGLEEDLNEFLPTAKPPWKTASAFRSVSKNLKLFSFYYISKNFSIFKYDKKKIKAVESPMKLCYYFNVEIEEIRRLCNDDTIEISRHFLERSAERGITYSEAKESVFSGKIIEEYPDDFPFPICLILGTTSGGRFLHVVVGIGNERLWFVTVYEPSNEKWAVNFSQRRKETQ